MASIPSEMQSLSDGDIAALRTTAKLLPTRALVSDKPHINLRTHLQERFMNADAIAAFLKADSPTELSNRGATAAHFLTEAQLLHRDC